jgi:cellulose biosynthesis protein BcsQ
MRVLSALYHEDIEGHIKYLPGILLMDIAVDKRSLLEMASSGEYDLVLISKDLPGSEEIECLIEVLFSEGAKGHRIVYLYGEYDDTCDGFITFLMNQGIYDFHVGEVITSKDIERLILRPSGKDKAYGYFQSRFDNEHFFDYREQNYKGSSRFLNSSILINQGFKQLFKGKGSNRIPFEKLVISIISNQATGKSHTAWNLACCLSGRNYATSLLNIDRGYSANLFFCIDELYYNLLDFTIRNNEHKDILDKCYKRKNLNIITGRLGDEKEIDEGDFVKLLYGIRTRSDITIIDTRTGLSPLTKLSIKSSTYDLIVFDCDIMHFHMNMSMLQEMNDDFVPGKTIALINNTNVKSKSHKFVYNELVNTGIPFKDIAFISSCGFLSSEMMHTGLSPYQTTGDENKEFVSDMDSLLDRLSARQGKDGASTGIFGR